LNNMVDKTPIDADFIIKEGSGKGTKSPNYPYKTDAKPSAAKNFLGSAKKATLATGRVLGKGAKATGKGVLAAGRTTSRGIVAAARTQSKFRKAYYEKRALGLERRQNIATYKANIAQQRFQTEQAKTTRLESRLARESIKRQAKQQRILEQNLSPQAPRKSFGQLKRAPLADTPRNRVNLSRSASKGGFFDGVGRKPLSDKGSRTKKRGGFFS
jgi:hypothetical protein